MASNLLRHITTCTPRRPLTNTPIIASSNNIITRGYITRAHPSPLPTAPIQKAIETLLADIETRHQHRLDRWTNNKEKRIEQRATYLTERGKTDAPTADEVQSDASANPYRQMDETVELALQLNLDPRKPGQSLRGSLSLPHGNGKTFAVAVFTEDAKVAAAALERGAIAAGGEDLVDSIKNGSTSITSFQRTLASKQMMPQLGAVARLLGPRGLMPNPKLGTIQETGDLLLEALDRQMSGVSNYRTDKEGIVRLGVGKGSFGMDKLLDNVRDMMNEIQSVRPESFGKGKKGQKKVAKGTKYYLKAHLSSTQSKGSVVVDIRTIDPTSSFFMLSDPI